jgi:RNA polymerase sigma-70 factor, ECF subfamily
MTLSHPTSASVFDDVYAEHRSTLHAYFLGRTGDPELALDLLQEVFLRAWRSVQTLAALPAERRHFWLFSVARNLVVDTYRRRGASEAAQERLHRLAAPEHTEPTERGALESEQLAELDAAIRRLPDDLRAVLVLHVLGERTSTEIGEILGRPAGTVRYQLAQARRRLADELHLECEP